MENAAYSQAIATERLSLAPIVPADIEALHALWTAAEVREFLWDGEIIPPELTREIVARSGELFAERGFGLWGIRWRDRAPLVGFAGYWYFRRPPVLELLFGVAPPCWRQGIATEAGRALLRFAFEVLNFQIVEASTDFANRASARVLEKLAMTQDRRETIAGLDTRFYKISRSAHLKARSPA